MADRVARTICFVELRYWTAEGLSPHVFTMLSASCPDMLAMLLELRPQQADDVVGGNYAGEFAFDVGHGKGEQVVFVEEFSDMLFACAGMHENQGLQRQWGEFVVGFREYQLGQRHGPAQLALLVHKENSTNGLDSTFEVT